MVVMITKHSDIRAQHSSELVFFTTEILHMPYRYFMLRWQRAVLFLAFKGGQLSLQGGVAKFDLDLGLHVCVDIS
jgi:hypothetical protein